MLFLFLTFVNACVFDYECRSNNFCNSVCNINKTCEHNSLICTNNETCNYITGKCQISCLVQNCPNNKICYPEDGKCYDCIYQTDCPVNTTCVWSPRIQETRCLPSYPSFSSYNLPISSYNLPLYFLLIILIVF